MELMPTKGIVQFESIRGTLACLGDICLPITLRHLWYNQNTLLQKDRPLHNNF